MPHHFHASWSLRVKLFTAAFVLILGVAFFFADGWGQGLIGAILVGSLVFSVRGYSVDDDAIRVHRMGWATRLPIADVTDVYASPGASMGSARVMGNGGLFGFYGWFRNATLGTYRAYATNEANTVVIEFEDDTVIVTPDTPDAFVDAVESSRTPA